MGVEEALSQRPGRFHAGAVDPPRHTGHIAVLKIRLVPEPAGLAMIAAGACALLLLRRTVHSSSSRRDLEA